MMNISHLWKYFGAICFAIITFGSIPGAMAGIYGSGSLDITNGTFAYDSTGLSAITPLVGSSDTYVEMVTGNFSYSNTLPPNNQNFNYSGYGSVDVNGGASGGGLSFSQSMDFGYTSFDAIIAGSPDAAAAFTLVAMLTGSTTGNTTIATSVGSYNFSWAYIVDALTANGADGRFNLWSKVDYSGSANPASLVFPANASFTARAVFNAVPEPGLLGLLGFGLLLIGLRVRRKQV